MNIVLMFEIVLSVVMLAQAYVFITKHMDNRRAVMELPKENAFVLSMFTYYDGQYVIDKVMQNPQVEGIGRIYLGSTTCNNAVCNLAVYSNEVIRHYTPSLQEGAWFSQNIKKDQESIQAVVSADIGLKIGQTVEIEVMDNKKLLIRVVGILKQPTQYLYPSGGASPARFSADLIIAQSSVVILSEKEYGDAADLIFPREIGIPENIFIFLNPKESYKDSNLSLANLRKYGELTPMDSLISTYRKDTTILIVGGTIFFIVFFFLAVTGTISNYVMQQLKNRRLLTIYYLVGMNWRQAALIEMIRIMMMEIIVLTFCYFAGKYGLLMLEWMPPKRAALFYGLTFAYTLLMFFAIGAHFLLKLVRTDISLALKELQGEE